MDLVRPQSGHDDDDVIPKIVICQRNLSIDLIQFLPVGFHHYTLNNSRIIATTELNLICPTNSCNETRTQFILLLKTQQSFLLLFGCLARVL